MLSEIIPPPLSLPSSSPTVFSNAEDVKNAKRVLDQLSAGAASAENASKRCQQTLHDVQKLLDPETLTQYKFKKRKPAHVFDGNAQTTKGKIPALSPFAKMVFDTTSVQYAYVTPEPSEADNEPVLNGHTPRSYKQKAVVAPKGYFTPQQPPMGLQQRQVQAVVPSSISPAERAQYQYVPDQDSRAGAQNLTTSHRPSPNESRTLTVDQRRKGDFAVQNLRSLLDDIFQAEDHLQPDTSDEVSANTGNMFTVRSTDDGSIPALQSETQGRLDTCVYKAVATGRLLDIEVEDLARAQRLCEGAVSAVETLSLFVGEHWSEEDINEWLVRIGTAESGLIAARTLIRIMNGASQQKELQSEDYLKEVLEALKTVIEGCLVPIVEEPATLRERIRGEKDGPPRNPKFVTVTRHREPVLALLQGANKMHASAGRSTGQDQL